MINLTGDIDRMFSELSPNMWSVLYRMWCSHRRYDRLTQCRQESVAAWLRRQDARREQENITQCAGKTARGIRCRRHALTNSIMCGLHV